MVYIVNLTVILDAIFRATAGNMTEMATLKAMATQFVSIAFRNVADPGFRPSRSLAKRLAAALPPTNFADAASIDAVRTM
jgi:hypothetical protein